MTDPLTWMRISRAKVPDSVPVRDQSGAIVGHATITVREDGSAVAEWPQLGNLPAGTFAMDDLIVTWEEEG